MLTAARNRILCHCGVGDHRRWENQSVFAVAVAVDARSEDVPLLLRFVVFPSCSCRVRGAGSRRLQAQGLRG